MTTEFLYDANLPCLDLLNTVQIREGVRVDLLPDAAAVGRWFGGWEPIPGIDATTLSVITKGSDGGSPLFGKVLELREAVRVIADAIIAEKPIPERGLEVVNRALIAAPMITQMVCGDHSGREFVPDVRPLSRDGEALVGAVALSAARLIGELDFRRLGMCGDPNCVLYFYDTSKNRSRRWCSMERCGNRAKVAAHHQRNVDQRSSAVS